MFLALPTEVELYDRGRISLEEFIESPKDRDILVNIYVKKLPPCMCLCEPAQFCDRFSGARLCGFLTGGRRENRHRSKAGRALCIGDERAC